MSNKKRRPAAALAFVGQSDDTALSFRLQLTGMAAEICQSRATGLPGAPGTLSPLSISAG
jgi:hypothetical protein